MSSIESRFNKGVERREEWRWGSAWKMTADHDWGASERASESRQSYRTSTVNKEGGEMPKKEGTKGSMKYVLPALTMTAPPMQSVSQSYSEVSFIGSAWQPTTG